MERLPETVEPCMKKKTNFSHHIRLYPLKRKHESNVATENLATRTAVCMEENLH